MKRNPSRIIKSRLHLAHSKKTISTAIAWFDVSVYSGSIAAEARMAFDAEKLLTGASTYLEPALKAAYEQGMKDATDAIFKAAQSNLTSSQNAEPASSDSTESEIDRAPRGTVPRIVEAMLADSPGRTIQEYEAMVAQYDDRIAPRSVGGELRRFRGTKYRQDRFNWFPLSNTNNGPDAPSTEQSDPLHVSSSNGGSDGTAIT